MTDGIVTTMIVRATHKAAANKVFDWIGWGAETFSVPLAAEPFLEPTHFGALNQGAGTSCPDLNDPDLRAQLRRDLPDLAIDDVLMSLHVIEVDAGGRSARALFDAAIHDQGLARCRVSPNW